MHKTISYLRCWNLYIWGIEKSQKKPKRSRLRPGKSAEWYRLWTEVLWSTAIKRSTAQKGPVDRSYCLLCITAIFSNSCRPVNFDLSTFFLAVIFLKGCFFLWRDFYSISREMDTTLYRNSSWRNATILHYK